MGVKSKSCNFLKRSTFWYTNFSQIVDTLTKSNKTKAGTLKNMDTEQEVQPVVDLMATLAETANNDSGILLSSINTVGDVSVNPLVVNQMSKRARKKVYEYSHLL